MSKITKILMRVIGVFVLALLFKVPVQAEGGDTFLKATDVKVNTDIIDNISSDSDKDYYKFTLTQDGYISLTFKHEMVEKGDWSIELLHDEKSCVYIYDSGRYDKEIKTCNVGVPAGTYYVEIYKPDYQNLSTVNYTFKVNYTQSSVWEKEYNATLLASNNVNVNTFYYGTICTLNDKDYYKFTLPQDGCISFTFKHEMVEKGDWNIELLCDEKSCIYLYESGRYDKEIVTSNVGVPAGTYYVEI